MTTIPTADALRAPFPENKQCWRVGCGLLGAHAAAIGTYVAAKPAGVSMIAALIMTNSDG